MEYNSTEDHRGREGKLNGKSSDKEKNHERLLTIGHKLRVAKGEVGWMIWYLGDGH